MDVLKLETYPPAREWSLPAGTLLVRILINGIDLIDLVKPIEACYEPKIAGSYAGLYAQEVFYPCKRFLNDPSYWFIGENKTDVLQCTCGIDGCWNLSVKITITDQVVTWSDFELDHRPQWDYSSLGTFTFNKAQYLKELRFEA